jgi:23S rRNA pseudouridine1911/1915/1917 synthase
MVALQHVPPSEQIFKCYLPLRYFGYTLIDYFSARFPYFSPSQWELYIREEKITVNGEKVEPNLILKEHDYIVTRMGKRSEPAANRQLSVIFEDDHIRVFNKAAPIPVHPSGRFFKNSMTEILKETYPTETPMPTQRLDASTTGVLLFAKYKKAAAFFAEEFSKRKIYKEYLALVEGIPSKDHFSVNSSIGKIRGNKWGSGPEAKSPKEAKTDFFGIGSFDGKTILKVIPHTGRTNQIRIHLADSGFPIINDPVYGNGTEDPATQMGLHAHKMSFKYLNTQYNFVAPPPVHFQTVGINF